MKAFGVGILLGTAIMLALFGIDSRNAGKLGTAFCQLMLVYAFFMAAAWLIFNG